MSIRFVKDKQQFIINTRSTTYAFDIVKDRYLRHIYYGKKTGNIEPAPLKGYSFAPYIDGYGWECSPDTIPNEISFFGSGDFRAASLRICGADGTGVTDFIYSSYRVFRGRHGLCGLSEPSADSNTQTLEVTMVDKLSGCILKLCYTTYPDNDVIGRYMIIENKGAQTVKIEKCMSLELALGRCDLDMISFWGKHPHECNIQRVPLHHGVQSVLSRRGASSHQYNPLIALCSRDATEEKGEAYGFNLVYSGSFLDEVEVDQTESTRVLMGLGSECFGCTLNSGESFVSPEAVMTYSSSGLGKMSRSFHSFVLNNIMPPVAKEPHPVVLNTWEACYFDIDEQKLISFAEEASKVGFDMLVMDDGWFGARNHDHAGLGDWFENKAKFPRGLAAFAKDIKARGVKFGIWIEPEMVNPDSELYRAHPEWALRVPNREPLLSRDQLVLDMSNDAVVDYLIEIFSRTFSGVPIDYFKWDMNRHMSNVGSAVLPPERQCEVSFRYMKGVYRLLNWFRTSFPNAVIETCSGGGGRYDLGMMPYGIQIWTSDNTNPYDRTYIQAAAMMGYPAATMSCHVSNPHGDVKSLDYRYKVAVGGMLGYELNILEMSQEIKDKIAAQIKEYKSFEHVMRLGEYYSLAAPTKYDYAAYYYTTADADMIVLTVIEAAGCRAGKTKLLKIKRALADATYTDTRTGKIYSGEELKRGIGVPLSGERDSAELFVFKKN